MGDDLTRANVLAELKKIKEWDGGGLHFVSNPGDNHVATCFMYSQIVKGKWVRYTPKKAGTWTCDEDFALPLEGDYGTGAKAGS